MGRNFWNFEGLIEKNHNFPIFANFSDFELDWVHLELGKVLLVSHEVPISALLKCFEVSVAVFWNIRQCFKIRLLLTLLTFYLEITAFIL